MCFPRRKPLRLKEYDYSSAGFYFVTICTQNRKNLFGEIVGADLSVGPHEKSNLILNAAGLMIEKTWNEIPNHYSNVSIDTLIVMPNHIHGIIALSENGPTRGSTPTLSDYVQRFKSLTTQLYCHGVHHWEWQSFDNKLWQRSFYDHIIRNEKSLKEARQYIVNNAILEYESQSIGPTQRSARKS